MLANIVFNEVITIPSERKSVKLIEPILCELYNTLNIHKDLYYDLLITCSEAVNNAIIHGNKCSADKSVKFEVCAHDDVIEIIVKDEGDGFDPNEVSNPLDEENLFKSSGRGLFLIRELSDMTNIISNSRGTTVNFVFEIK